MTTENRPQKSRFFRGIATALNSCGNAVVVSYDAGAKVVGSLYDVVKKIPGLPTKIDLFSGGSAKENRGEAENLYRKIKAYEGEIKAVYYEIGKASVQLDSGTSEAEVLRESGAVKKMLAQVKEYEQHITALKERIVELEEEKQAEASRAKEEDKERYRRATLMAGRARKGKEMVHRSQVVSDVNMTIKEALIHGNFDSASDRAIFDKVATDLLDKDVEIRMLAAAELGKMGNKVAVPVLHAAIAQGDGPLVTEIINSLIALSDPSSVPIMFECTQSPNERVRVGALRGLYKLAPDDERIKPIFHESLGDAHPEVRKTAATMLGWLDDASAVPALVQCLIDEDVRVRKAVIAALANIRDKASMGSLIRQLRDEDLEIRQRVLDAIKVISGEQVEFNVSAVGETLDADIERLKSWWQDIRLGKETAKASPSKEFTSSEASQVPQKEAVQKVKTQTIFMAAAKGGIDAAVAKAEAEMAAAAGTATDIKVAENAAADKAIADKAAADKAAADKAAADKAAADKAAADKAAADKAAADKAAADKVAAEKVAADKAAAEKAAAEKAAADKAAADKAAAEKAAADKAAADKAAADKAAADKAAADKVEVDKAAADKAAADKKTVDKKAGDKVADKKVAEKTGN